MNLKIRIFYVFLSFLLFPVLINAQDYYIYNIEVHGLVTLSEEDFLEVLDISLEDLPAEFSRRDIRELEKKTRETRYFRTYRIEEEDNTLYFYLQENPLLGDIEIRGNNFVSTRRLRRSIRSSLRKEKVDKYYSFFTESSIHEAVFSQYRRRNLFNVQVNIEKEITDNIVDVVVEIDERDHYHVSRIIFEGNENFTYFRLMRQIQTRLSRFFRRRYYYPELVQQDIGNITRFYHDNGFLDVNVDTELTINEELRSVRIHFIIDEGKQYYWNDLEIFGNTLFTDDEIRQQLQQLQQDTFSYTLWKSNDAARVFDLYANEGFIDTFVETDFIRNDDTVDLVLKIQEGKRYYVGNINIIRPPVDLEDPGFFDRLSLAISPPVREEVIRNHFRVQKGDIYKKHQVERGYFNLVNSNLFERVEFEGDPTPFQRQTVEHLSSTIPGSLGEAVTQEPDTRDINIHFKERPTGKLILSAGYGEGVGVFGQVQLREENVRGRGHTLDLSATIARKYHNFYGRYHIPFFRGNLDQSLSMSAFSSLQRYSEYEEFRRGGQFEIGNKINDYLRWYWGVKLFQAGVDLDSDLEPGRDVTQKTYDHFEEFDRYLMTGLTLGLREDTRDSFSYPTSGYVQHYKLELLTSDDGELYPAVSTDYRFFYPLTNRLVWASNLSTDWTARSIDRVPIPERNYLGGVRTIRGYAFRGIVPKDPLNRHLPLGGTGRVLAKTEIRRKFTDIFSLAGFLDSGVLGYEHLLDWEDSWKFGTGIQFAFRLPIGNISIDVAHALNPDERDKEQTIHFNMGFNF